MAEDGTEPRDWTTPPGRELTPEEEMALLPTDQEQMEANLDWFSKLTPLQRLRATEASRRFAELLRRCRPVRREG